ncbi:hypothetical protein PVK06_025238 [Gossypium arboreum]|uniref:Retrotransposon Copia-like N-terminal domain-containing protein n=1 Tax=Gossypium arboreum TaxID=29729 RepID=A0ABR0PFW8_GOSAR|nr:hypothetical protein PVK06_025238 [Gossypium arboreum]
MVHPATPTMISDSVFDSHFFSTKNINILFDDSNYLLWHQQVLLAIKTYKLQNFLIPQTVVPPSLISDKNGVLQENTIFVLYEQQDSALASWLLSSVS